MGWARLPEEGRILSERGCVLVNYNGNLSSRASVASGDTLMLVPSILNADF